MGLVDNIARLEKLWGYFFPSHLNIDHLQNSLKSVLNYYFFPLNIVERTFSKILLDIQIDEYQAFVIKENTNL